MSNNRLVVKLDRIECLQLQEYKHDELYCVVQHYDTEGNKTAQRRLPEEGFWLIHQNEIIEPGTVLFTEEGNGKPKTVRLIFKEEDIPEITRGFTEMLRAFTPEAFPDLVDDYLGEIYCVWQPDNIVKWVCGMNIVERRPDPSFIHIFDLTVSDEFSYRLHLSSTLIAVS